MPMSSSMMRAFGVHFLRMRLKKGILNEFGNFRFFHCLVMSFASSLLTESVMSPSK